jgi:hypothetical protein
MEFIKSGAKIMATKEFQDYTFLTNYLFSEKRVDPNTISGAPFLEKTYVEMIGAYNDLVAVSFSNGKRVYPNPLDFSLYQKLNILDSNISLTLHTYIGVFEKRLRSYLINAVCSKIKAGGHPLCEDPHLFNGMHRNRPVLCFCAKNDVSMWNAYWEISLRRLASVDPVAANEEKAKKENDLLHSRTLAIRNFLQCFGTKPKNKSSLAVKYLNRYGYVPAFIGMHNLSLGTTTVLFGMLPCSSQEEFWKSYSSKEGHLSTLQLAKYLVRLKRICDIRNRVNHYEPFIPMIFESSLATINSLESILKRLRANFEQSQFKPTFVRPDFTIPVTENAFNMEKYILLCKVISQL